jgi:hypothetical protein
VCSWRRIIRLTNACSFPALHLRFENKGKAGLLSFCSLPISLFLGPLSVFVHAPHWPLGSALFFSSSVAHSFSLFFFAPSRSLIFFGFIARECQAPLQLKRLQSHYCRNRSCGRRRRRRRLISRNGAVCVMGMAICNPVTEVLKSCNQAPR